jgi:hypothetical protein
MKTVKTMKTIINRMRWLSVGVYLGIAFVGWLQSTSKNDDKTIDLTKNWSDYKHNHNKEKVNA